MEVKSVYNFVPAPTENEVFKPEWAEQVSHDIPFSDGESGEIELTITAKTPIFIRNGHTKADKELFDKRKEGKLPNPTKEQQEAINRYLEFSNIERNGKKQYFIPATSVKGMVRNVLEIISKSRLSQIQNHRHSVRQIIKNKVVDEGYKLNENKHEIHAGWLIDQNGKHYIYDCGKPLKIRYTDLDRKFKTDFYGHFKKGGKAKLKDKFSNRTAKYKYETFKIDYNKTHKFEEHTLDENDKQKSWVSKFQPLKYARFTESDFESFQGHIVCVGQSAEYGSSKNDTSRKAEYIFKGKKAEILNNSAKRYLVPKEVYETFLFINRHNKSDELEDWKYFKHKENSGIPVFFRKNEKEVKDFGIPFMYKEPADYSVEELNPNKTYFKGDEGYDLAEIIFGTTRKNKELKGRVYFSHIECKSDIDEASLKKQTIVLGSPRSSYFPFYLQQHGRNGILSVYNTYNTKSTLSGFKRYYVHKKEKNLDNIETPSEKMATEFKPLPKDTIFKGKIRFHNLRKAEIGALISAITFHNQKNDTFHSLGYAKPLGLGKVKLDIQFDNQIDYLKAFEFEILKEIPNWSIAELLTLAKEANGDIDYMELSDFQIAKNEGKYLEPVKPFSGDFRLVSDEKLDELKEAEEKRLEEICKQEEERERLEKEEKLKPYKNAIASADKFFKEEKWEEALKHYQKAIDENVNEIYPKQQKNICQQRVEAKSKLEKGISIPEGLADFNEGKKKIENFFKAKGQKHIEGKNAEILKAFIVRCIKKSDKRWKKAGKQDWKLVEKWVGKPTAQAWFSEITKNH